MSENTIPDGWGQIMGSDSKPQQTGQDGGLFLRLVKREKPYIVRLVSSPEPFRQHWAAFKPIQQRPVVSPVFDVSERDKDIAWSVGGWIPSKKYAILVFDREDGQLKIMQGGEQIFGEVKKYIEQQKSLGRDCDPCGPAAPDWVITVGTKEGQTHYDCGPDMGGAKPLTAPESASVEAFTAKVNWRSFFEKTTPEQLKAMWESLPEAKRYNPDPRRKGPMTAGGAIAASAPAAPAPTQVVAQAAPTAPAPAPTAPAPTAPQAQAPVETAPAVEATTSPAPVPAQLF